MCLNEDMIDEGAKKLISNGMRLKENDSLVILTHKKHMNVAEYLLEAAKRLGLYDVLLVQFPENMRPIKNIPTSLTSAIAAADALLYLIDRQPIEHERLQRQIRGLCKSKKRKYCFLSDPKLKYFQEGINADYNVVTQKCNKIVNILRESEKINVTSGVGTDISFSLYKDIVPRGPILDWPRQIWNQAPEGEVMTTPIEHTFTGKLVIDGTSTNMGVPPRNVVFEFDKGKTVRVEGDKNYLNKLLSNQRQADPNLHSLIGIWIAEFSIGTNDWAVLDGNNSNNEKVAGTVHFGMGHTMVGKERGEKFHFDSMLTTPKVTVTRHGERLTLINSSKLKI